MRLFIRFTVGLLQLAGGILGVALIAADAFANRSLEPAAIIFVALYSATILAGVALLRNHKLGKMLSIAVQAAQLPRIAAAGCTYHFVAGGAAWLMLGTDGVGFSYLLGSAYMWSPATAGEALPFGVNIVAAVALSMLLAMPLPRKERRKREKRRLAFA